MEYRPLEVTIISAKDIKDVNLFSKMDVYVLASIDGDPRTEKKTPVDHDGGKNPSWNFTMNFSIDESLAKQNRLILILQLKSEKTLGVDRDVGEVHVPIKELLDNPGAEKASQFVSYQVRTKSGKAKGELNFSYKFGEKVSQPAPVYAAAHVPESSAYKVGEPVTAYPAAAAVGGSSMPYPPPAGYPPSGSGGPYKGQGGPYPPPPTGYPPAGYGNGQPQPPMGYPPQQPGYGYPPQQPGYGYPPQGGYGGYPQQPPMVVKPQKPKKNKMGGMGMGLGAGLLGGLLIGDMISDVGDYDGGFDDCGGGFDF
ncbi:hypothetical protein C5167_042568 [Papaver somniferum]|uniref:C2 domain-containing protein n=1 Tax=Papaver somniferum TaxID=3469 RepID=A0A4Y7L366_PAPSO|nr:protein SRC2-like [Papaver somniferum]RZC79993.1 hypothetical protein C5167_042568 [Papaver somniferum]